MFPRSHSWGALLFLICLVTAWDGSGALLSPFITNPANSHRYAVLTSATWTSSEAEAVSLGGHLATIRNQAEQNWVFQTFGSYGGTSRLLWIGLNDGVVESTFAWVSGAPFSYTNWAPGEPNGGGSEDFVAMYYPGHSAQGQWNDWGSRSSDPIGIPFNGVVELAPETVITLVATGSVWRYWDQNPGSAAANWRATNFNDSAWPFGPGQLGYGDSDEATRIGYGGNANNKYMSAYFRRQFQITNPGSFSNLVLRVLRDDGAVIFLNGQEVFRSNMPTNGTIAFNTPAVDTANGGDETTNFYSTVLSPALLLPGTNLFAVEVHQVTNTSTDLSFDLELVGLRPASAPELRYALTNQQLLLSWPDLPAGYLLERTSTLTPPIPWKPFSGAVTDTNGFSQVVLPRTAEVLFYRLRHP